MGGVKINPLSPYLYIPNLIGYLRLFLSLLGIHYARSTDPRTLLCGAGMYTVAFFLDMADGAAARAFNQHSTLGAVLDMVSDRIGTAGLLMAVSTKYPSYLTLWVFLMWIDMGSHWYHMHAGVLANADKSHKEITDSGWVGSLLRLYYGNRVVLALLCGFAEAPYVSLLVMSSDTCMKWLSVEIAGIWVTLPGVLLWTSMPGWTIKQFLNCIQLVRATKDCNEFDASRKKNK